MNLLWVFVSATLCWLPVAPTTAFEPITNLTVNDFEAINTLAQKIDFEPISNLTLDQQLLQPISNLSLYACPDGFYSDGNECISNEPAERSIPAMVRCPQGQQLDAYSRSCRVTVAATVDRQCPYATETVDVQSSVVASSQQSFSHPAQTTCSNGYTWNGRQCLRIISIDAECADNYRMVNGTCQTIEQGYCADHRYELLDGQCVYKSETSVQCPTDHRWDGKVCVHTIPSCPYGYSLTDGMCKKSTSGYCPPNTQQLNGVCVHIQTSNVRCSNGFWWNGLECVHSQNIRCEAGSHLVGERCIKEETHSPIYMCPNGTRLSGTMCYGLQNFCPSGYSFANEQCVVIARCPIGFDYTGNQCVRSRCPISNRPGHFPVFPTCPGGYIFLNSTCYKHSVPLQVPGVPTYVPELPSVVVPIPTCPQHSSLQNGTCIYADNTSESSHSVILYCPANFLLQGDRCVSITHIKRPPLTTCAFGYTFRGGACISVSTGQPPSTNGTITITCPSNTVTFSNGTCIPIDVIPIDDNNQPCLPGYRESANSACVIDTDLTIYPCQNGTTSLWNNGSCIFDHSNIPNVHTEIDACPEGFLLLNKTCVRIITKPPRCSFGFTLRSNGMCTKTVPHCLVGYVFRGSACYPIVPPKTTVAPQTERPSLPDGQNTTTVRCNGVDCTVTNAIHVNNTFYHPNNVVTTNENNVTVHLWSDGQLVSVTNNNETTFYTTTTTTTTNKPVPNDDDDDEEIPTGSTPLTPDTDERCCEVVSPRQCKKSNGDWHCYHRRYHRCGKFCTQSTVQLAPRRSRYRQPVLVMAPPPPRYWRLVSQWNSVGYGSSVDCSGCIFGGFRCSNECFRYGECGEANDCYVADAQNFCNDYGGDGCSTDDGCFEE